jgi:hypothetical protein
MIRVDGGSEEVGAPVRYPPERRPVAGYFFGVLGCGWPGLFWPPGCHGFCWFGLLSPIARHLLSGGNVALDAQITVLNRRRRTDGNKVRSRRVSLAEQDDTPRVTASRIGLAGLPFRR